MPASRQGFVIHAGGGLSASPPKETGAEAMSGAVSLGGVLAAVVSPMLGPVLDRRGARLILCLAVLGTGLSTMALSLTQSLAVFYLLFCFARMNWAGPFDLGLYGALNNWFV